MRYPYKFSLNSLNINGNVKLTNKWAISFNSGYDFNAKEITQTAFNITRDLHCFSMTAAISPFGRWKYYNFTSRANASILQDLKWEQRSQTQRNIQWYCCLPNYFRLSMFPQILVCFAEMLVPEEAVISG